MKQIKHFRYIDDANEWLKQHKDYEVDIQIYYSKSSLVYTIFIIYELIDIS